jgi:hypothetical protein
LARSHELLHGHELHPWPRPMSSSAARPQPEIWDFRSAAGAPTARKRISMKSKARIFFPSSRVRCFRPRSPSYRPCSVWTQVRTVHLGRVCEGGPWQLGRGSRPCPATARGFWATLSRLVPSSTHPGRLRDHDWGAPRSRASSLIATNCHLEMTFGGGPDQASPNETISFNGNERRQQKCLETYCGSQAPY